MRPARARKVPMNKVFGERPCSGVRTPTGAGARGRRSRPHYRSGLMRYRGTRRVPRFVRVLYERAEHNVYNFFDAHESWVSEPKRAGLSPVVVMICVAHYLNHQPLRKVRREKNYVGFRPRHQN